MILVTSPVHKAKVRLEEREGDKAEQSHTCSQDTQGLCALTWPSSYCLVSQPFLKFSRSG